MLSLHMGWAWRRGGACLTGCVPSTGWSTWDPSAITTTSHEPPIIRLRPSHQRCLLLCKHTAPKLHCLPASPQRCHVAFRHAGSLFTLSPTDRHSRCEFSSVRLHRDHTSPASIAGSSYYYSSSSTCPTIPSRPSFFAHFSALPSLHLLAREAAQASVVPARRAESFQSRGPPFRSLLLGPASASREQASKCPRRNAKNRQCTDPLPRLLLVSPFLRLSHNLTCY